MAVGIFHFGSKGDFSIFRFHINRLNLYTGKVEKRIPLPNYPGMTKITIFKDAIYFLYDQKNYPYFVRLYRYHL